MAELRPYNLPGFGVLRPRLFPHAQALFDFLDGAGFIQRLEGVDQLGALRVVFPGAHHSRLEYVMAQLAIITEICQLRGPQPGGLGLSSDAPGFGKLAFLPGQPSYGEILQSLVILANVGHLPNTFSAERAFLKYLVDHPSVRRAFRSGLDASDRTLFDQVISGGEVYRLHMVLTLFLLRRFRARENGGEIARFGTEVLRSYLSGADPAGNDLEPQWRYYRGIRRFTYLTLDALYTPVPFALDLASIFLSLRSDGALTLDPDSVFQRALVGLEGVMRDSVFLAPEALLQHSRATDRVLSTLEGAAVQPNLTDLRSALAPGDKSERLFARVDTSPRMKVTPERTVYLAYEREANPEAVALRDTVQWETERRRAVGYRSCRFGAEWDPRGTSLRVAAGIGDSLAENVQKRIAFKVARELILFDEEMQTGLGTTPAQCWSNHRGLLRFLCATVFGWSRRYRFTPAPLANSRGVVIREGSTAAGKVVAQLLELDPLIDAIDPDHVNEMDSVGEALRIMEHRGLVLAFLGSTEVLSDDRSLAQFDGLVFRFTTHAPYGSCVVVEAKNMPQGHTPAKAQLETRLDGLGYQISRHNMTDIPQHGAFAVVQWD